MGIESMEENNDRKDMFDTAGDAADFAENIAATIRKGLKEASESVKKEDIEDINVMLGKDPYEEPEDTEYEDTHASRVVKKQNKSKKVVGSGYSNNHSYGLDNIELRNEVVQDKRRAIRVESAEESNVLSDAIQKHLEESVFGEAKIQEGFHIVNIMQECLKSENILEYMQNMSCCTCERCQADVLAATLSHLPAKYVVMYKKSTNARISFYHDNYKMDILASIMRAIRDVKEHPHHGNDRIQ